MNAKTYDASKVTFTFDGVDVGSEFGIDLAQEPRPPIGPLFFRASFTFKPSRKTRDFFRALYRRHSRRVNDRHDRWMLLGTGKAWEVVRDRKTYLMLGGMVST